MWLCMTGRAYRCRHMDDPLDQLRLLEVRPRGVAAFELPAGEPVTVLQRQRLAHGPIACCRIRLHSHNR